MVGTLDSRLREFGPPPIVQSPPAHLHFPLPFGAAICYTETAMLKQSFRDFISSTNTDGSGRAASYVRALDMLGLILRKHYPKPTVGGPMWHGFSLADIHAFSRSGDASFKLPKKASALAVCGSVYAHPTMGKL